MNIIFVIEGGIGKSIMATAVCQAIKKKHPRDKLIVVTAYPEVFICNPDVDKCLDFNHLNYFYSDYIENNRYEIMAHNPYNENKYFNRGEHLIQTWCEMFGLKYDGEEPKIYLSEREVQFYARQFTSDKPIFVIQTNGGAPNQELKYSWARDIPNSTAQQIVDAFKEKYNVVHIRRDDQLALENTTPVHADFRSLFGLIKLSSKRLFMDSFAQHTAKALGMDSVVCWVANTPLQFGYENNINILANKETKKPELKHSFLQKYNIDGKLIEFPYNTEQEIFDVNEIIEALLDKDTDGK